MSIREMTYGIVGLELPYQEYDEETDMGFDEVHADYLNKHDLISVSDDMGGNYTIVGRKIFFNSHDHRSYDPAPMSCNLSQSELNSIFDDVRDALSELPVDVDADLQPRIYIFQNYV